MRPPSLAGVNTIWSKRGIRSACSTLVHRDKCSLWDWFGYSNSGILTPDRCKPFDSAADGYVVNPGVPFVLFLTPVVVSFVRGEGAVAIVVKPLESALADNDHIYAVVRLGQLPHPPFYSHTRGRSWAPPSTTTGLMRRFPNPLGSYNNSASAMPL